MVWPQISGVCLFLCFFGFPLKERIYHTAQTNGQRDINDHESQCEDRGSDNDEDDGYDHDREPAEAESTELTLDVPAESLADPVAGGQGEC